jgi:hypothetical protein
MTPHVRIQFGIIQFILIHIKSMGCRVLKLTIPSPTCFAFQPDQKERQLKCIFLYTGPFPRSHPNPQISPPSTVRQSKCNQYPHISPRQIILPLNASPLSKDAPSCAPICKNQTSPYSPFANFDDRFPCSAISSFECLTGAL